MMRREWAQTLVVALALGIGLAGCGRKAQQPARPAQTASVPLPEWAPKDPSPEFLRAARFLKPVPMEMSVGPDQSDPAQRARAVRLTRTYTAAWEFFGTLTDEQMNRLLHGKPERTDDGDEITRLYVPVKSLTPEQRAALDRWFEAWRDAMQGVSDVSTSGDRLVDLYRGGAEEDLSNVDAGFNLAGHAVNITFRIHKPDGSVSGGYGCTIARY